MEEGVSAVPLGSLTSGHRADRAGVPWVSGAGLAVAAGVPGSLVRGRRTAGPGVLWERTAVSVAGLAVASGGPGVPRAPAGSGDRMSECGPGAG